MPDPLAKPYDARARVKGQFDKHQPLEVNVGQVRYLGNPVHKNGEEALHGRTHLAAYAIDHQSVPRWARVWNQFDRPGPQRPQVWLLEQPELFLVPAGKKEAGAEPPWEYPSLPQDPVSHFVCYKVLDGPRIDRVLALRDQFGATPSRHYSLIPKYFGVPVTKTRFGDTAHGDIHFEQVHLAIYALRPDDSGDGETPAITHVTIRDQFTGHVLRIETDSMLAVPSLKPHWDEGHEPPHFED